MGLPPTNRPNGPTEAGQPAGRSAVSQWQSLRAKDPRLCMRHCPNG
jgi:hypothetical protein